MTKIWGTTIYLGEKKLETLYGNFITKVFQNTINKWYILTMIYENTNLNDDNLELYTRIHSSCVTSEMLHSQDCDCVEQLNGALKKISQEGKGIFFYLIQEGRGCGYIGKARACQMVQYSEFISIKNLPIIKINDSKIEINKKITTFDAYKNLGMKMDYREYDNIKEILQILGIYEKVKFILLTNNPDKINGLKNLNIKILKTENLEYIPNPFNYLYLKSKTVYGHDLNKTDLDINNYNLPFNPIKPFEPFNLKNIKRFIYCASYYIPLKPFKNNFVLNDKYINLLNINLKKPNNLYKLTNDQINKFNIYEPYWFKVNLFYDISTNLDYIVLEYHNPYSNSDDITPLVRFHSESLFDRLPLKKALYKNRYKKSIYEIVKNGKGFLLLFYRDGRGSGLGYYLLNSENNNNKIGIDKDTRDYNAAVQLLKFFIKNNKINMLYSDFSKYNIIKIFNKYKILVDKWINIDDYDKKGILSIKYRIFNLNFKLSNLRVNDKLILNSSKKYFITGIGSSKSHAFYFKHLAKIYFNINIEYIPISYENMDFENHTLILISQGLSYNTHIIIKKWKYKNIILLTGKNNKKLNIDDNKKFVINQLIKNNCKIFYFENDKPDDTLVRITGPTLAFYYIYKLLANDNLNLILKEKYEYQKISSNITNLIINNSSKIQIYIISDYPEINYIEEIGNKLMETLYCKNPIVKSYHEFTHGTYQTSLIDVENSLFLCTKSNMYDNLKKLFNDKYSDKLIFLNSFNNNILSIIDYQLIISYWIDDLISNINNNFKLWEGKDKQKFLYSITPTDI
jgi:3,4-dihydroxy 2-butanone 4-phosphate synthase / GTP cyclohydrolase II